MEDLFGFRVGDGLNCELLGVPATAEFDALFLQMKERWNSLVP